LGFTASIDEIELSLEAQATLFSPNAIDAGTRAMLSCVRFQADDKVLDLGCGYGVVGLFAAKHIGEQKVWLLDNNPVAIEYASRNARLNAIGDVSIVLSDGFSQFRETGFTKILCNPPYHADFSVPKHFIHKGFNRLEVGGSLWMVTKRDVWYRNKLHAIFGSVRTHAVGDYHVFEATKQALHYANHSRQTRIR